MNRTARAVCGLAVAASFVGLSAGCGSDESHGGATISTSTVAVEGEPVSAIPAEFEGLDPCTLLTSEEARNATGAPSIGAPRRIVAPGQTGSMAACSWRPPEESLGVYLSFTTPPTLPSADQEKIWTDEIGHPARALLMSGACHVYVWYSGDRMANLKIYLPEQQRTSSLDNDVCGRSKPLIKQVFAKIPWK
ncbi:DUF3558 family protein [Nocardia sp. IBHARD005]|uniref:DUF3558 family protein n=1 Tax=Nocardia sp. IBHARD005 TaxID=3457765 RepID=UPI00405910B3